MKTISNLTVILFLICNSLHAQNQSAKDVLDSIKNDFLVDGGIILPQSNIDNMKDKINSSGFLFKKEIKNPKKVNAEKQRNLFMKEFQIPASFSDFQVYDRLSLQEFEVWKMGSYIFEDQRLPGNDSVDNRKLKSFLIADNGQQMTLVSPINSNNYELFITHSSAVNNAINNTVNAGDKKILEAKASAALSKTFRDSKSLNIIYGRFENDLASIFSHLNDKGEIRSYYDFPVLYDVWKHYASDSLLGDKYIIKDFHALVVEVNGNTKFLKSASVDVLSEWKANIPYFKMKGNLAYNWKSNKEVGEKYNKAQAFLKTDPNFEPIPSPENIVSAWNELKNQKGKKIRYPNSNYLNVSDFINEKSIVQVKFGPILSENYDDLIVTLLNENNHYIKRASLSSSIDEISNTQNLNPWFTINLELNEQEILLNSETAQNVNIIDTIKVAFRRNIAQDGEILELADEFPIYFNLHTGPTINIVDIKHSTNDSNSKQKWHVELVSSDKLKAINTPKLIFSIPQLAEFSKELIVSNPLVDTNNDKKWSFEISGKVPTTEFNLENMMCNMTFLFQTQENIWLNRNSSYNEMKILVENKGVKEDLTILSSNIEDLLKHLPDTITFSNGIYAKDIFSTDTLLDESSKLKYYTKLLEEGFIKKTESEVFMLEKK